MFKKITSGVITAAMLVTAVSGGITLTLLLKQIMQKHCKSHFISMSVSRQARFLNGIVLSGKLILQ